MTMMELMMKGSREKESNLVFQTCKAVDFFGGSSAPSSKNTMQPTQLLHTTSVIKKASKNKE